MRRASRDRWRLPPMVGENPWNRRANSRRNQRAKTRGINGPKPVESAADLEPDRSHHLVSRVAMAIGLLELWEASLEHRHTSRGRGGQIPGFTLETPRSVVLATVCRPDSSRADHRCLLPKIGYAARRAWTISSKPSITMVGGVRSDPSGRATLSRGLPEPDPRRRRQTPRFPSGVAGDSRCVRCPVRRPGLSDARPDQTD